jgi:hypothetical protein
MMHARRDTGNTAGDTDAGNGDTDGGNADAGNTDGGDDGGSPGGHKRVLEPAEIRRALIRIAHEIL